MKMTLKEMVEHLKVEEYDGDIDVSITGIAYDSRKIKPGDLFVCISGFAVDGHQFIAQAIDKGAAGVMVEKKVGSLCIPSVRVNNTRNGLAAVSAKFFNHPTSRLKLIGITGTNGKTTTTYLIKNILQHAGYIVGLIGTNQNMIDEEVLSTERTTPESFELQKLFDQMVKRQVDNVVMEVSSHALSLNRVDECVFDVAVFTNLTQDHLDFHGSMEEYLKAKTLLFQRCKKGIVNIDDPHSDYILAHGTGEMITFGIDKQADIHAINVKLDARGVSFDVVGIASDLVHIRLGIPGKFSVYNALGSIAACVAMNIEKDIIQSVLKTQKGVPGRAQVVETKQAYTVLIDYAHSPDGLENIIRTVKGFAKGRVVTLFGCGGDRDRTKRPIMGQIAGELSDFCIVTSDNPRTENPTCIIQDIIQGIDKTSCVYKVIENRLEAIKYALDNAQEEDVIILAGKGHETYQEINGVKHPFDENIIVQELLLENT